MSIEVWVTRKAQKYVRRTNRTTRKVCKDLDHARNYAKAVTRPDVFQGRDTNPVTMVQVWVDDDHRSVWRKGKGWSPVEESDRLRKFRASRKAV